MEGAGGGVPGPLRHRHVGTLGLVTPFVGSGLEPTHPGPPTRPGTGRSETEGVSDACPRALVQVRESEPTADPRPPPYPPCSR